MRFATLPTYRRKSPRPDSIVIPLEHRVIDLEEIINPSEKFVSDAILREQTVQGEESIDVVPDGTWRMKRQVAESTEWCDFW